MICKHFVDIWKHLNEPELFFRIVKWFHVLLYNSHNLISVICLRIVCSIWPIDRTLSGASTSSQNGPRGNGNEDVLHIPQIATSSDCLISHREHLLGGGILSFYRDAVGVFYSCSRLGWTREEKDKSTHIGTRKVYLR